jgi:hypothetical protein
MPTSDSTRALHLDDGARYKPKIVRSFATVALTSAVETTSASFETHRYQAARVTMHAKAIGAATTVSVALLTGPDSTSISQTCLTSSGAAAVTLASTVPVRRTFVGLDRYSALVIGCAGTNASTGFYADVELI